MYNRKAIFFAVAGLLASSGYALGANAPKMSLSLDPTVITADDASAGRAPLMMALDKVGAAKPLDDIGLNVYGWVEAGYTYNHRHHEHEDAILPGPFNHEVGNHFMLNQVDIRFERLVDSKKWDVGGLVEVMYGTDAGFTHSSGLGFNGNDPSDDGNPTDAVADKDQANYQFDLLQAYVTVNVPVGNGLKLTIGKFVTLLGYETVEPDSNLFYSHSYIFNVLPFSQTGVLGTYQINDQWTVTAGVTRGWDQTLEDSGPDGGICQVDAVGNITWKVTPAVTAMLNWGTGPENFNDPGHWRTVIDPIVTWAVTDKLKLAAEGIYLYDGGINGTPSDTHAYGDDWGAAVYASYTLNDYVTLNGRAEKLHSSALTAFGGSSGPGVSLSVYEITLGTTITPLPKDPIGKNLMIRPEIRYDFTDSSIMPPYSAGGRQFKDQLTFGADVIFKF